MCKEVSKWDIVEGTVMSQVPYGLLVQVPSREIGVVESMRISDLPISRDHWPKVGAQVIVACEGRTSGSIYSSPQLRLTARQSDIDLARIHAQQPGQA
jgi:hypothetical protein